MSYNKPIIGQSSVERMQKNHSRRTESKIELKSLSSQPKIEMQAPVLDYGDLEAKLAKNVTTSRNDFTQSTQNSLLVSKDFKKSEHQAPTNRALQNDIVVIEEGTVSLGSPSFTKSS